MIAIIAPCFNEESTIIAFLNRLNDSLKNLDEKFHVIIADDCSQDNSLKLLSAFTFPANNIDYDVLELKFNSGHQGVIYQGLLYSSTLKPEHAIIMDSDGEDDPQAIPLLLQNRSYEIVTVKRGKRSESPAFQILYLIYKAIFKFITGKTIDYGNYCMISSKIIERINHTSFIHLPAYLLKQKATRTKIVYNRQKRIDGRSKMGYKGLFLHAFKSMIEFGEDLLMLFLKMFVILMILFFAALANILYQKFISHTAILGWFSTLAISLVILAVVCIGFFVIGVLLLNLTYQQNMKSYKEIYSVVKSNKK
jgi:glycosyltransferase involved in cell wall biosynthesis